MNIIRRYLLRKRLRKLMPQRKDEFFRLVVGIRKSLRFISFGKPKPLPQTTAKTIKFRRCAQ